MNVHMYLIVFTSGYKVRTFEFDTEIMNVAQRLKNNYASYYGVEHEIERVICEDCSG